VSVSRRKLALLLVAAAGLLAVALAAAWFSFWRPSLEVVDLHGGDSVSVRSGVSLIMPEQASGIHSLWRSMEAELNNPLGLSDEVELRLPTGQGETSVGVDAYWVEDDGSGPLYMLEGGTHLAVASDDGAVEVRWRDPEPGITNVFVVTRLPNRLPGYVAISGTGATDAQTAWRAASDIWRRLSITGVELPPPPG